MIKIENVVLPSPEQWEAVIRGLRNPMNSWWMSDSYIGSSETLDTADSQFFLGDADLKLMKKLVAAGSDHAKFMRIIPVYMDITAPLYWWKEFDTYKVGTVANSCSTMHKIAAKEFTLEDFSHEHLKFTSLKMLNDVIEMLNEWREHYMVDSNIKKDYWWQLIQLLPSTYNQRRTVMLNYEVLRNIYNARKNHKLDEWRELCKWIETELPYFKELIGI